MSFCFCPSVFLLFCLLLSFCSFCPSVFFRPSVSFYYSVIFCHSVILSLFVILSSSVFLHCKDNSNIENRKGVNYLSINALLACKRRPLRPLLTPFWSPIKHLFCVVFVTN